MEAPLEELAAWFARWFGQIDIEKSDVVVGMALAQIMQVRPQWRQHDATSVLQQWQQRLEQQQQQQWPQQSQQQQQDDRTCACSCSSHAAMCVQLGGMLQLTMCCRPPRRCRRPSSARR